jgi:hypothetical protein
MGRNNDPAEIGVPSARSLIIYALGNDEELRKNLDTLEIRQELEAIKEAKHKSKMERVYNKKVFKLAFKKGEYVL